MWPSLLLDRSGRFERVQAANTAGLNVFEVARYQRHAVGLRRRRQQRIDRSQRFARVHSAPDLRDSLIDGQYSFSERCQDLLQPMFQRGSSLPISGTQPFDSLSYLPDDENTQKEFVVAGIAIPGGHVAIAAPAFADFRDDVRINQVHSKANGSRLLARPLYLDSFQRRRREQFLEGSAPGSQALILVGLDEDGHRFTMAGYRLRPFSQSAFNHLAEARLGFLDLPFHQHQSSQTSQKRQTAAISGYKTAPEPFRTPALQMSLGSLRSLVEVLAQEGWDVEFVVAVE